MNKIQILRDIANQVGGSLYEGYSGRGMYGKTCYGITCESYLEVIELAAEQGIKGARWDNMGKRYIVYWPDIIMS